MVDRVGPPGSAPVRRTRTAVSRNERPKGGPSGSTGAFAAALQQALRRAPGGLRFSAHAERRLRSRGIEVTDGMLRQLETAVDRAAAKGARESLIVVDNVALVVSVRNRTVITAMDRSEARENVFTNIDSAVLT